MNVVAVGPKPSTLVCPSCRASVVTRVDHKATTKTHIIALVLCLFLLECSIMTECDDGSECTCRKRQLRVHNRKRAAAFSVLLLFTAISKPSAQRCDYGQTLSPAEDCHKILMTHGFDTTRCWPCVCVPYCMDSCQNADHYCPSCNAYLGSYQG